MKPSRDRHRLALQLQIYGLGPNPAATIDIRGVLAIVYSADAVAATFA